MNDEFAHTVHIAQEDIARLAYQAWETAGRPPDRDLEFWLLAEQRLSARRQASADQPRIPVKPQVQNPPRQDSSVTPPLRSTRGGRNSGLTQGSFARGARR